MRDKPLNLNLEDARSVLGFFSGIFGRDIDSLTDEQLLRMYSAWQFHFDQHPVDMEHRSMIDRAPDGRPIVPYRLPEGLQLPASVLHGSEVSMPGEDDARH